MKKPLIIVHQELPKNPQDNNPALPLQAFVDLAWEDEKRKFQEETGYVIQPTDSLEEWIKVCEEKGLTHHMFFHLMVIKLTLSNPL